MQALASFVREAPELAELAHDLAGRHGDGQREVEAAAAAGHRNCDTRIRQIVNMIRDACGFAAEQEYIAAGIGEVGVGVFCLGREQHKPALLDLPPVVEAVEVDVPGERGHLQIIHAGAPEVAVGEVEAGGLDDINGDAKARCHAQNRAGIAGDVGLVEGDAEG